MAQKIKWGVIGAGGIARRRMIPEGLMHAKNASLVSVYDINPEVNKQVAEESGAIASENIEALLNSGIDAVYIASPANLHLEHVTVCARAKKHVLCEKPLGITVGEAEDIVKICSGAGILLGTGLMMRFLAQHQAALKLIEDGKLGKPVYGRAQLSCWYPPIEGAWRQDPATGGGGSLMDMGSHCIDLLEMFLGKIKSVSCFINNNIHPYASEDSAIVSLFFENGAIATVDAFFCIPDNSSKNRLELYGEKGSILAQGTIGQSDAGEMVAFLEESTEDYNAQQSRGQAGGWSINPVPVNTYRAEIEEFSNAVLEKRELLNNGETGLVNQQIIAACYESARTGKVINIKY